MLQVTLLENVKRNEDKKWRRLDYIILNTEANKSVKMYTYLYDTGFTASRTWVGTKYEFRNLVQICEMLEFPRAKFSLKELLLNALVQEISNISLTEDDESFPEGKRLLRQHITRERNSKLVKEAKRQFKEKHGALYCEVCNFNFEKKYGDIGKDYIEAHHTKFVCSLEENSETKVSDLVLVCSCCHRMLHRKRPLLTIDEIKKLID